MSKRKKACELPINKEMCSTCPFRSGVPQKYACLRNDLAVAAMSTGSRICHQTGNNNAFHYRTGKPEALCRGARDLQLQAFAAMGFISAPTDEAWEMKWKELNPKWKDKPCLNRPKNKSKKKSKSSKS